MSDGVPPPKKMLLTRRPGVRPFSQRNSSTSAEAKPMASTGAWRTWLLKSQ
jgi:hypothetical protein